MQLNSKFPPTGWSKGEKTERGRQRDDRSIFKQPVKHKKRGDLGDLERGSCPYNSDLIREDVQLFRDVNVEEDKQDHQSSISNMEQDLLSFQNKKLSLELENSIIRELSDLRKHQLEDLKTLNRRKNEEMSIRTIPIKLDTNESVKMIKRPNYDKEFNIMSFKNLQQFRAIIEKRNIEIQRELLSFRGSHDSCIITEISLVSFFYYLNLVEPIYVPYLVRTAIDILYKYDSPPVESITEENLPTEVFKLLQTLQFEKVSELLSNFNSCEIYEEISSIVHPIKQYFSHGLTQSYQNHEVEQVFRNMTLLAKNSYELYSQSENLLNKIEVRGLLPSLRLLSGDLQTSIDNKEIELLHELCLKFVFTSALPKEKTKLQWKQELSDKIASLQNQDAKNFHMEILGVILDDPYQSFNDIKARYPAWLSEFLLYIWDTNGMLNEEIFQKSVDVKNSEKCTIIEAGTEEYVRYVISLKLPDSINICDPYIRLLSDSGTIVCLAKLASFDYKPSNSYSYDAFQRIYEREYKSRELEELKNDFEALILDKRANYFQQLDQEKQEKANFYEILKYFSKRRSVHKFNQAVLERINLIFLNNINPVDVISEEMPGFRAWRKRSPPFNFLATYCQLISSIIGEKEDTQIVNETLKKIFCQIECPIQYKILVLHKISVYIIKEEVKVDKPLIMDMLIFFEQFTSKAKILTDKYFKAPLMPLDAKEILLIRTALKESLTCKLSKDEASLFPDLKSTS
ncbi:unnamed protein product [Moneuplotes crassus]|uniref:Uncharacterized protein n=1 Tax=Euplotes crassus TaxID=5936 RepID=A0AAD1Y8R3_EUPCR|nr:unnamed protein product [Moneuplotes crassus]